MNWYEWESQEAFDLWLNAVNEELGYPNLETNTLTYTEGYEVEGKIISYIEDIYANGAQITELRVVRNIAE
jgi:hypothetical protein